MGYGNYLDRDALELGAVIDHLHFAQRRRLLHQVGNHGRALPQRGVRVWCRERAVDADDPRGVQPDGGVARRAERERAAKARLLRHLHAGRALHRAQRAQ
eukprot:827583-Rhodomonas_salina.1